MKSTPIKPDPLLPESRTQTWKRLLAGEREQSAIQKLATWLKGRR